MKSFLEHHFYYQLNQDFRLVYELYELNNQLSCYKQY
jgi:hypothetical protein